MNRKLRFHRARLSPSDAVGVRPFCGWYEPVRIRLTNDGADDFLLYTDCSVVLVQVHIGAFRSCELPQTALNALNAALSCLSDTHGLLLRFVYDWDGNGAEAEPESIDLILHHIAQCGYIAARYAARILLVQGLFIGSWGEMHTSRYLSDLSLSRLTEAMLSAFPDMPLAVRTPELRKRVLLGRVRQCDRIGIFNDGMMGSMTDLGTFSCPRAEANAYFAKTAQTVPYGGELVDSDTFDAAECRDMLAACGATYLNVEYDASALAKFKQKDGQNGCLFDEVGGHLGFRMRIVRADVTEQTLRVSVINEGYARNAKPLVLSACVMAEANGAPIQISCVGADDIAAGQTADYCAALPMPLKAAELYCTATVGGMAMPFANQTEENGVLLGSLR